MASFNSAIQSANQKYGNSLGVSLRNPTATSWPVKKPHFFLLEEPRPASWPEKSKLVADAKIFHCIPYNGGFYEYTTHVQYATLEAWYSATCLRLGVPEKNILEAVQWGDRAITTMALYDRYITLGDLVKVLKKEAPVPSAPVLQTSVHPATRSQTSPPPPSVNRANTGGAAPVPMVASRRLTMVEVIDALSGGQMYTNNLEAEAEAAAAMVHMATDDTTEYAPVNTFDEIYNGLSYRNRHYFLKKNGKFFRDPTEATATFYPFTLVSSLKTKETDPTYKAVLHTANGPVTVSAVSEWKSEMQVADLYFLAPVSAKSRVMAYQSVASLLC